jgi:hypothetical protein
VPCTKNENIDSDQENHNKITENAALKKHGSLFAAK